MKRIITLSSGLILLLIVFILSSCERGNITCPPESTSQSKPTLAELIALPAPDPVNGPVSIEIGSKMQIVDKLVDYPICNDEWSGTVYVSCDATVAQVKSDDEDNPLFFKGCNLKIEPGTIVYVAAHNDSAYYKGCSCHTEEDPNP